MAITEPSWNLLSELWRFYHVFRLKTDSKLIQYWFNNAVGNVRGLPKGMHLTLHWDIQGLAVHSQFPHHTLSATGCPGWRGVAEFVDCAAGYYPTFQNIKMLSSGKQNNFATFSLLASPVTVHALCSFRGYYNAAVTCTRCLTPFLLQTPSDQHLFCSQCKTHSYAKRPTCNCGAEEQGTSVWPWVFCPSHWPEMGLKGTSGPVMGISKVIPRCSYWKTPFQGALMITGLFKLRSLRSTDAFPTCVYFVLELCRFHLLNKYLILFGAFLSFWILRDLVARSSVIN